jgi:protoheme IX farnesyltransferase
MKVLLKRLAAYYELTKPRTVWLLVIVGACAPFLSKDLPSDFLPTYFLGIIFLTLAVAGTNAFTCWIDRDLDAVMERTRNRPLARGEISPRAALLFSISTFMLGIMGTILLFPRAAFFLVLGFLFSAVLYNGYLKRRSALNIIFASPAGMMPVLYMWFLLWGKIDLLPVLFGLLVVFWTPAHIWSLAIFYKDDYKRVKVPMLPVVEGETLTIRFIAIANFGLGILTFLIILSGNFSLFFIIAAMFLNLLLFYLTFRAGLKPDRIEAYRLFKFSSPYLALVFILAVLDKQLF